MKLIPIFLGAVAALAACAPAVPDSGATVDTDVNFTTYQDIDAYRSNRDAELNDVNGPTTGSPNISNETVNTPPQTNVSDGEDNTDTEEKREIVLNNPRISDEQNFDAVADRESIQSDAERLKAQRDAYQVIEPTNVPTRSGSSGPNIVEYAINTRNPVGQKVYRRGIVSQARYERNCAKYKAPDLAQEAFLAAGGPQKDKLGLDPDGDGFACDWNPEPFRAIHAG